MSVDLVSVCQPGKSVCDKKIPHAKRSPLVYHLRKSVKKWLSYKMWNKIFEKYILFQILKFLMQLDSARGAESIGGQIIKIGGEITEI